MSKPSFNVNKKPTISQEAFLEHSPQSHGGGKFLENPGTYDLTIVGASWRNPSEKDEAWTTLQLELQNVDGKSIRHFQMIPTECSNGFLFGADKKTFAYEGLVKFIRAFGISIEYENTMEVVAALFGNLDRLVGKTIRARVGYKGAYLKYQGKNIEGVASYQILKKDGSPLSPMTFADAAAAKQYAELNRLKLEHCNILEVFAASAPVIDIAVSNDATDDLPF